MSLLFSMFVQLCPTLCDPMDCNAPGSSVHGILQATILEWVACLSPGDLWETKPKSRYSLPSELRIFLFLLFTALFPSTLNVPGTY